MFVKVLLWCHKGKLSTKVKRANWTSSLFPSVHRRSDLWLQFGKVLELKQLDQNQTRQNYNTESQFNGIDEMNEEVSIRVVDCMASYEVDADMWNDWLTQREVINALCQICEYCHLVAIYRRVLSCELTTEPTGAAINADRVSLFYLQMTLKLALNEPFWFGIRL